jgi:serine/threonine protein phosphatase PrpC
MITKFSFATKGGISAHNPHKKNQDAYITNPHLMQLRHCHFFSVCDGHGHNGQDVSGLLKTRLPYNIETRMKAKLTGTTGYPETNFMTTMLEEAFS